MVILHDLTGGAYRTGVCSPKSLYPPLNNEETIHITSQVVFEVKYIHKVTVKLLSCCKTRATARGVVKCLGL